MVAVNNNIIIMQFLLSVRVNVFILILFQRKTIENNIATIIIILLSCTYIMLAFVLVMFEIRKKKINSFLDILASHKL